MLRLVWGIDQIQHVMNRNIVDWTGTMNTVQRPWEWLKVALREHWLALLILFVPINWVVYQSDADNVVPFLILPAVAVVVGVLLRPRHVWFLWLASVVTLWIVVGYMGKYDDPGDETVASIMFEAFIWMALGILIPVWIGRLVGAEIYERRHPDQMQGT